MSVIGDVCVCLGSTVIDAFFISYPLSPLQARVSLSEVVELLDAAEAKAMYGLAINWKPLEALTQALLDRGSLTVRRARGRAVLEGVSYNREVSYGGDLAR